MESVGDAIFSAMKAAIACGIGSVAMLIFVNAMLPVLGFTANGIVAGSLAAWFMSTYGGFIAQGSLVSILQSAGVIGFGTMTSGVFVVVGGGVALLVYGGYILPLSRM